MAFAIFQTLMILLNVAKWIIIIQAIVSWLVAFNIINTSSDFVRTVLTALERMTEPLYRPIRKVMPDLGALDLSPMVVLLVIVILQQAILPAIFAPLV
ncbi:MAG TPA: YggT family protein [Sphingobium sp.]